MNKRAYSEVYQIIQYLPESEYRLIPKEQIEFIKSNMDNNVERICTINSNLDDTKLSKEAKTILLSLFHMNVANENQKSQLEHLLKQEEEKQSKILYDNMFKNKTHIESQQNSILEEKEENTELVSVEENSFIYKIKIFFKNLWNKIKR